MSRFLGRKSKIFLAVFIINGVFLFVGNLKTAQAYHATSSYNKLFNDTLTSQNWNDLFSDFANTWLPVSLNGPVGIATAAPTSGLDVNGLIKGTSMYSSGNVGFGVENPTARLSVVPASGYSILAGSFKIGNVALPTEDADAATKGYVDSFVASATSSISNLWGGNVTGNIWSLNSGNVGIGTSNPTSEFQVSSTRTTGFAPFFQISAGKAASNAASVAFTRANNTQQTLFAFETTTSSNPDGYFGAMANKEDALYILTSSGGGTYTAVGIDSSLGLRIGNGSNIVSGSVGASITQTGKAYFASNVGIGTTTPTARLSIAPTSGYAILVGNYKIGNVALPTLDSDAATKGYVDAFVASATSSITGVATYIGITPTMYTGDNNGTPGYSTAEDACATAFSGATVCTPDNILASISAGITLPTEDVWIFAGPPGYTAAANDCEGRSVGTTAAYGTYWQIAMTGRPQGRGLLMRCNNALRIACCR
jgi:hypothetical protein